MIRKRFFDLVLGAVALLMALPVMLAVAAAVRLALGRPVLFVQSRAGRGGRAFRLLKFRTMTLSDRAWDPATDAERLTPLGRWLRRWSLDELPQLWNVVRGEMSLVGPRPLPVHYLPRYSPVQARRHRVRPGITGLAQVNGRNATTWAERLALDVRYVDHWSWRLDLHILAQTVRQVLSGIGVSAAGQATIEEFTGTEESTST